MIPHNGANISMTNNAVERPIVTKHTLTLNDDPSLVSLISMCCSISRCWIVCCNFIDIVTIACIDRN